MNNFAFARPASVDAAIGTLRQRSGAQYIAGGTNILDLMKDDVEHPPLLVDINALPLRSIERRSGGLYIGALARMSDVASNQDVRSLYPMIAIALEQSASPQLRNMASMSGNILQRTRCPYFRDPATPCNKRAPGTGCGAIGGVNRMQAVLGTSDQCIAAHASDVAVALIALDAVIHVTGQHGERTIAMTSFYREPGTTPQIEHAIAPGELITGLTIPSLPFAAHSAYVKARDRAQYEFALASAAVALDVANGNVRDARIALGGVGTIPWRTKNAEDALRGGAATRASYERVAEIALTGARGYGQNDFKIPLAKRTLVRALEIAAS